MAGSLWDPFVGIICAMPFDFAAVAAPFRMQPGLRRMAPGAAQLTPNRPGDRALAEKLQVLRHWPAEALVAAPGFDPGPALAALCAQAANDHPGAFLWDGDAGIAATRIGWGLRGSELRGDGPADIGACLAALPSPWRLPGLLALACAEDFAVIDGGSAHIPWIAACLPSHWAPADRVGRHFAEVHAPVADNQVLLAAGAHLARLVSGTEAWERFVWTLTRTGTLQLHPAHSDVPPWPAGADANVLAARAFFRTEHQTFIPVPDANQAVFTIHVESRPLADAVDSPERAAQLHAAIASMSQAVLAYRGLAPARERLLEWLAARAARAPNLPA
jgi:hypothetical protein